MRWFSPIDKVKEGTDSVISVLFKDRTMTETMEILNQVDVEVKKRLSEYKEQRLKEIEKIDKYIESKLNLV